MQIGCLKMLLWTLSAPKRGQMGSKALTLGGPRPLAPFGRKMSLQGRIMAPIWDLKWRPKRGFEIKLALGSSKNEVLGAAFENVRIFMNFRCENACKIDPFYV